MAYNSMLNCCLQSIYVVNIVSSHFIYGIYIYIGIFLHICISTNLHMWHLMGIFSYDTFMAIGCEINVAVCCFLTYMCSNMGSVCGLQKYCSGHTCLCCYFLDDMLVLICSKHTGKCA